MRSPSDDFMRHFRWITPLLLAFSVYMLQSMYRDFKRVQDEVTELRIDMAFVRGRTSTGHKPLPPE